MNWIAHNWFVLLIGGLAFGMFWFGVVCSLFQMCARLLRSEQVRTDFNPPQHEHSLKGCNASLNGDDGADRRVVNSFHNHGDTL